MKSKQPEKRPTQKTSSRLLATDMKLKSKMKGVLNRARSKAKGKREKS